MASRRERRQAVADRLHCAVAPQYGDLGVGPPQGLPHGDIPRPPSRGPDSGQAGRGASFPPSRSPWEAQREGYFGIGLGGCCGGVPASPRFGSPTTLRVSTRAGAAHDHRPAGPPRPSGPGRRSPPAAASSRSDATAGHRRGRPPGGAAHEAAGDHPPPAGRGHGSLGMGPVAFVTSRSGSDPRSFADSPDQSRSSGSSPKPQPQDRLRPFLCRTDRPINGRYSPLGSSIHITHFTALTLGLALHHDAQSAQSSKHPQSQKTPQPP